MTNKDLEEMEIPPFLDRRIPILPDSEEPELLEYQRLEREAKREREAKAKKGKEEK